MLVIEFGAQRRERLNHGNGSSIGFVAIAKLNLQTSDKIGSLRGIVSCEALLHVADFARKFGHSASNAAFFGLHQPTSAGKPSNRRGNGITPTAGLIGELRSRRPAFKNPEVD